MPGRVGSTHSFPLYGRRVAVPGLPAKVLLRPLNCENKSDPTLPFFLGLLSLSSPSPPLVPSPSLRDRGHASDYTRPPLELTNLVDFPPVLHWFHVDKISSAHVYLRLPESI